MQQIGQHEQVRMVLQQMHTDMNDFFMEQKRCLQMVYRELKERLDNIQHVVTACNGVGSHAENFPHSLGSMDHITPVFTPYASDNQHNTSANRMIAPSTPPCDRMQFAADAHGQRSENLSEGDRPDWAPPTATTHHEVTPAVSPNGQWANKEQAAGVDGLALDYACFATLDRLINEDDAQHGMAESTPSPYTHGDDTKQLLQQKQDLMAHNSKTDVIHLGALNSLQNQHLTTSLKVSYVNGRPKAVPIVGGAPDEPEKLGIEIHSRCKILVEFKRKRVLQFESKMYIPPGSYVMVGGDRGEDLGLVTYTWCEAAKHTRDEDAGDTCNVSKSTVLGVGLSGSTITRSIGLGTGTVLRLAQDSDVTQLHTVQVELERRAIDVCSQRVLERGLPMTIVDAEYQFDKNKLTFFYEAQQRMDFRELVRDLYKTFRARIWMEVVEN